jgi:H+/Cl- antiporter ClcA
MTDAVTDERGSASTEAAVGEPAEPLAQYLHVVIVALIGAVSVLAWLFVFVNVSRLLWENEFVLANRWVAPAICMPFSLLAGLLVKHRNAPTTLNESFLDSLSGDVTRIDWRTLPVTVLMAWASLFSGAVLGPEGGIGGIASKIAALYAEKVGVPVEHRRRLVFSTIASAYNGLIASPLFTSVMATEVIKDPAARAATLPANLIGGVVGYLVFFGFGSTGFQDILRLAPAQPFRPVDLVLAALLGVVGLAIALVAGAMFQVAAAVFGRFEGREVRRALVAGLIFSAVGVVAPILLFSGEGQIHAVVEDPAGYGVAILVAMALAKLALLAVAFKSGFLGGPVFPVIFASVCIAEALGLLRIDVLVAGIMSGVLVVLFRAPLMVILLVTVMLGAGPGLMSLIVLAVAAAMLVQPYAVRAISAGRAARAA